MRRPGAMELWSPPRRDNHLIKMGLLFPRYSIVVWTYLIYNYRQWVSRPDCSTPIALDLLLPLLSRPSLGQISGPLIAWEHRNALKEGGDVYVQSPALRAQRVHPHPPAGNRAGGRAQQNQPVQIGMFTARRHVWAPPESKGTRH